MNVFRILGDLSHLLAMILLLVKIWRSKSCAGERRRGGAGRDQDEDSGSEGTPARALPKTSVKFFDIRGSGRLCGSVASVTTESSTSPPRPPIAPSLTGQLALPGLLGEGWRGTFPCGETLPLRRREEYLKSP